MPLVTGLGVPHRYLEHLDGNTAIGEIGQGGGETVQGPLPNGSESSQQVLRPMRVRLTNPAVRSSPICLAAVCCDIRQGVDMSLMVVGSSV